MSGETREVFTPTTGDLEHTNNIGVPWKSRYQRFRD